MFPQLLLFLGACITSTLAQADTKTLNTEILTRCFEHPTIYDNGHLYVNGQKKPLPSSMENFISLVEKLELGNPNMGLSDVLFVLLKNYTAENVLYRASDKYSVDPFLDIWTPNSPNAADMTKFQNMWETNENKQIPDHIDPFEDNEKCSLFFMLSHTINNTARSGIDLQQKTYVPSSLDDPVAPRADVPKTHIPREQGVVSVNKSSSHAVALGRVLLGLYVGMKDDNERIKNLETYGLQNNIALQGAKGVDSLYLVTLADQLMLANYPIEASKAGLGENGKWTTVEKPPLASTSEFPICPTVYELPINNTAAYTFSSVRGGVDGLILGEAIKDIYRLNSNTRLSQILKMYYGPNGIREQSAAPPSNEVISFCNRIAKIAHKENILKEQMTMFHALVSKLPNPDARVREALIQYENKKRDIMEGQNGEIEKQCRSLEESKGGSRCESFIDVIFVMDTTQKSDDSDLQIQREIIGRVANNLDMGYGKSTMTVFSDQRNGTSGLSLLEMINNTTSSACAACSALQFEIDPAAQADKDLLIQSVSKVLKNVEDEEKALNGARGKVVIFFNFQEEETVSSRLRTALRNLYMNHVGVEFMAVGSNREVLKTYTRNQIQNIVTTVTTPLAREVADILGKKICEVPSKLQYEDCKLRRNEASAVYEGLITPNTIQRWAMYPKYFYKSLNPKIFFQADNRQIEVCQSRAYSRAEDQQTHCLKTTTTGARIEFNATNPCKAFSDHNCAPWFFTVKLVDENSDLGVTPATQYCQEINNLRCETLDQVKFKVSHEGIRCSSCFGLFPSPSLLLGCLAVYIITKFMNVNF